MTLTLLALGAAPAHAIVGGEPVPDGELKAIANISISGAFGCTGTLVAPGWVLTAAHCSSLTSVLTQGAIPSDQPYPASQYEVVLGSARADGQGGERHGVKRVVVASSYGLQSGGAGDVALLELDKASPIAPIRIAAEAERGAWRPTTLATIAGFGLTKEDAEEAPDRMQRAQVPIRTDSDCTQAYGEYDPDTMLCAGFPQGGTDTCQGDSGGPLLVEAGGTLRVVGATSFGEGCAREDRPGVYARVAEGPLRAFVADVAPAALAPEPGDTPANQPGQQPTSSDGSGTPSASPPKSGCKTKPAGKARKRCRALARCNRRNGPGKARRQCRARAKQRYGRRS